jgi:microcystin-dependent protein
LTTANLINSTATTKAYSDSSTAIATTAFVQSVLPRGMIVMWGGLVSAIPTGWQLCDGSNSTPDLRGQFIVGAGGSYTTGNTGGTSSITLTTGNLPAHTHLASLTGATDQDGAHNHTVIDPGHLHYSYGSGAFNGGGDGGAYGISGTGHGAKPLQSAVTGVSLALAPTHSHNVTLTGNVGLTGGGQSIDTRPPFYALCYIQKMY